MCKLWFESIENITCIVVFYTIRRKYVVFNVVLTVHLQLRPPEDTIHEGQELSTSGIVYWMLEKEQGSVNGRWHARILGTYVLLKLL